MAEIELKPCPFCGGEAAFVTIRAYRYSKGFESAWDVTIGCKKCHAILPGEYPVRVTKGRNSQLIFHSNQETAAAAWNRRCGDA